MPVTLEHVEAPLAQMHRRLHPREPLRSLAYVEMEDNGAVLLNISEWGLAVHAAQVLTADRRVRMRFKLPQSSIWIRATGRIVWRSESGKRAGICFADLSEDVREQIREWISAQATPSEIYTANSQSMAQADEASHRRRSDRITAPGVGAAAHQAATQASERTGLAGLIARTKKRFLAERLPTQDLTAEPLTTDGNSIQNHLAN
jgi:PilZ domain